MDFITSDVQHQNVFVHLDSYHMHIEESGFEAAVTLCGDRLGYVHIGESHRCVITATQVAEHTGVVCRLGSFHNRTSLRPAL